MMGRLRAMREPLKYVQGRNALLKFQEEMGYMGTRWLFVCSKSGYQACHDKLEESFGQREDYRRYEIFGGVSSHSEIDKMKAIVEEDKIDTVVAVGGGSAVDTAKATAFYTGKHIVIIPTVAATDAPCTGLSVIYNDDHSFDKYLFYPTNPDAVLVDTVVIANAPVKFLIAGMGDALGTFFEGRASIRTESASLEGTGITRAGQALAKLCYDTLRAYGKQAVEACKVHAVTPALEAIVEANVYLSGVGADNVNCAAAHSFYNGVTALGIAHVFEGRHVFKKLSVAENLAAGAYLRKDSKAVAEDIEKVFKRFPRLEERKSQLAGTLSGGEQQMLAIGRALVAKPKIILFDEPSLGLAPLIVKEVFEAIREIKQEGTTILLVEQNSKLALNTADRAYVLKNGEIALSGKCSDLLNNEEVKSAYLGAK